MLENQVLARRQPVKKTVAVENPKKPHRKPIKIRRKVRNLSVI